jgi:hypothetical protein
MFSKVIKNNIPKIIKQDKVIKNKGFKPKWTINNNLLSLIKYQIIKIHIKEIK